jgi:Trehalose and maltose hydrolases (possible phosphorylases)
MWGGAYFQNYDYIAQTYGAYSSNHVEQAEAIYQPVLNWETNGTWFAQNIDSYTSSQGPLIGSEKEGHFPNGVDGILYMVAIQPWGVTGTGSYDFNWRQLGDASMSAIPFMWKYQYTQDTNFLSNTAYPYMKLCADFWEDYLESKENGKYVTWGCCNEGVWDKNPSLDLGLIRNLFKNLLEYSQILNLDANRRAKWQDIVDNLSSQPTIVKDGKTCFNWSQNNTTIPRVGEDTQGRQDRGLTFLEFIYPCDTLGLYSDPTLKEWARNSLDAVEAMTHQHIPRTWSIGARVGYNPNVLYASVKDYVDSKLWSNLTHDGGIENCAIIEGMNSLVMNSEQNIITIFPAWPSNKNSEFRSLRAKGAFLVNGKFENGAVTSFSIYSEAGKTCTVHNPWPGTTLQVKLADNTSVSTTVDNDNYTFNTTTDTHYYLTPSTTPAPGCLLSEGKSYTKSVQPSSSFPDTGNTKSTNGIIANDKYGGYGDGNSYGYNLVNQEDTVSPEITIDLGSACQINKTRYHGIMQSQYMPDSMEVYTSSDGSNFTLQGATTTKSSNWMEIYFATTNARYVKFKLTKTRTGSTDDWLFVDELEVLQDTFTSPVLQSRARSYTKSIQPSASYPDNGNAESTNGILASDTYGDGKSYGYNISTQGSTISPEITIDLGSSCQVNKAKYHGILQAQYFADQMEIYTSTDGNTFTLQGTTTFKSANWMEVTFPTINARYIKFKLIKTRNGATDDWLFIDELEVWG